MMTTEKPPLPSEELQQVAARFLERHGKVLHALAKEKKGRKKKEVDKGNEEPQIIGIAPNVPPPLAMQALDQAIHAHHAVRMHDTFVSALLGSRSDHAKEFQILERALKDIAMGKVPADFALNYNYKNDSAPIDVGDGLLTSGAVRDMHDSGFRRVQQQSFRQLQEARKKTVDKFLDALQFSREYITDARQDREPRLGDKIDAEEKYQGMLTVERAYKRKLYGLLDGYRLELFKFLIGMSVGTNERQAETREGVIDVEVLGNATRQLQESRADGVTPDDQTTRR